MEGSPSITIEDLRKESTVTLMDFMAMKAEEEETAKLAFSVFYERFAGKMKAACVSVCSKSKLGEELPDVIFHNTMINAFTHAEQFHTEAKDDDHVTMDVRRWLYGIAKNEMLQELKKITTNRLQLVEDLSVYESPQKDEEDISIEQCPEMTILNKALDTLEEKDRGILLMCYQYMEKGSKITSEVAQQICKVFGVTEANRRQIKTRALKKIMTQIEYLQSKGGKK